MPAFQRSFNPYSNVPPPPASLPDFEIISSSIRPLTDEEAGSLIDSFLQTQDGKILTLHRLADHLLGRRRTADTGELEELEHVLEEERRREGGLVVVQPDDSFPEEDMEDGKNHAGEQEVPKIEMDKRKARKEERRMKKEKEREKRKKERQSDNEDIPSPKRAKKEHRSKR